MRDRQVCIDCGKQSPETETNYTLISAQFGWRLTRRRAPNGDFIVEWRCAECWREHKKKLGDEAPSATRERTLADRDGAAPRPTPPPRPSSAAPATKAPSRPPSKPGAPRAPSSRPPSTPAPPAARSSPPGPTRPRRP